MSNVQQSYSFKSIGNTQQELDEIEVNATKDFPIGIKTPVQFSNDESSLFKMHKKLIDQISDNLRNMILTNHGERLGIYRFGANIHDLVFELGNQAVDQEAMRRISSAVGTYMPYIQLQSFIPKVTPVNSVGGGTVTKIELALTFNVPEINAYNKQVVVTMMVAG